LISVKTVRPGLRVLTRMVGSARAAAVELTYQKVMPILTDQLVSDLDLLLIPDPESGMTRLAWLSKPAVDATAHSVEVYPAASLKRWGLPHRGYKTNRDDHRRQRQAIIVALEEWAQVSPEQHQQLLDDDDDDDLVDALVCALTAACHHHEHTTEHARVRGHRDSGCGSSSRASHDR
jgi:hypothetical protein